MTARQRRRNEMLWRIACWMRCHDASFIIALSFFIVAPVAVYAAEIKSAEPVAVTSKLGQPKTTAKAPVKKIEEKKIKFKDKSMEGTLMFLRKNKISVETASNDEGGEDMYMPLDEKVKISRAKNLSDIKPGDKVRVKYRQTYLDSETKGGEPIILKTAGIEITLLEKAAQPVKSEAIVALEEKGT